eukprot:1196038-Prorocentrum_minimum.AAC.1
MENSTLPPNICGCHVFVSSPRLITNQRRTHQHTSHLTRVDTPWYNPLILISMGQQGILAEVEGAEI